MKKTPLNGPVMTPSENCLPSRVTATIVNAQPDQMDDCDHLYSLIEEEKYDEAIKYSGRKDMRNLQLAQSLSAYCHACQKKYHQALEIARVVMRSLPNGESTLNAINHTLKQCRREHEMVAFYEALIEAYPNLSVHYLNEIFAIHARLHDAKKMQFTAQKLYKLTSQRCFVFWTVTSMLLQEDLVPTMLTVAERMLGKVLLEPLAVASLSENLSFGSNRSSTQQQPGADELELYIEVCCRQGRYSECINAIGSLFVSSTSSINIHDQTNFNANGALVQPTLLRLSAARVRLSDLNLSRIVAAASNSSEVSKLTLEPGDVAIRSDFIAVSAAQGALQIELLDQLHLLPDQWSTHLRLSQLVVDRLDSAPTSPPDGGDPGTDNVSPRSMASHRAYLRALHASQPQFRGPLLAELELLRQWREKKARLSDAFCQSNSNPLSAAYAGSLPLHWERTPLPSDFSLCVFAAGSWRDWLEEYVSLICAYADRFLSKQCCFTDLRTHIEVMSGSLDPVVFPDIANDAADAEIGAFLNAFSEWAKRRACVIEQQLDQIISAFGSHNVVDDYDTTKTSNPLGDFVGSSNRAIPTPITIASSQNEPHGAKGKKKSVGNPRASNSGAASFVTHKALSHRQEADRIVILEQLCSISNLRQFDVFCAMLLLNLPSRIQVRHFTLEKRLLSLYSRTKAICVSGVGGERDVQPGDELLLCASSQCRATLLLSLRSTSSIEGVNTLIEVAPQPQPSSSATRSLLICAKWVRLLLYGSEMSPHAFSHRVEILEPLRVAAMAQTALVAYDHLKPRHMQHDSLSYLVIPLLLESGWYVEARDMYVRLNSFARQAQLDTAEMIARSFRHSNYSAALDMQTFLRRVTRSLYLHVAVCEMPLLDLLLTPRLMQPELASEYLQQFCDGNLTGVAPSLAEETPPIPLFVTGAHLSIPCPSLMAIEDIASLVDNADYCVIGRFDSTSTQETKEIALRRIQIGNRIRVAQLTTRVLFHCLDGDVAKGRSYLTSLIEAVEKALRNEHASVGEGGYCLWSQTVEASVFSSTRARAVDTAQSSTSCHSLDSRNEQSQPRPIFETALWAAVLDGMHFALATAAAVEAGLGNTVICSDPAVFPTPNTENPSSNTLLLQTLAIKCQEAFERSKTFSQSLTALKQALWGDALIPVSQPSKFLTLPTSSREQNNDTTNVTRPLDPDWIRRCSAIVRTLTCYLPLLLQAALLSVPGSGNITSGSGHGSAKSNKKAYKGHTGGSGTVHKPVENSGVGVGSSDADAARLEQITELLGDVGKAVRLTSDSMMRFMGA